MNREDFIKYIQQIGININEKNLKKLEDFSKQLKEYNEKVNLTSITDEKEIYLKHFYDSLCIFKSDKIKRNSYICDLGTGAGFPGIVMAIVREDLKIDLIESNKKKCVFLQQIKESLSLTNIDIINDRAENYAKLNREKYDIVTSRAVANLKIISELSIPIVKVQGYFIPLKASVDLELKESQKFIELLNCRVLKIIKYKLPVEESNRTILEIKKNKKTDKLYPREYSKIKKDAKI